MSPIAALTGSSRGDRRADALDHGRRRRAERALGRVLDVDDVGARRGGLARLALVHDAHEQPHDRSTRAPRLSNVTSSTLPSPSSMRSIRPASSRPAGIAAHHAVDGRPPRALAGARRPGAQERLDERGGARMEATALHVGERVADQLLDVGQRGAELLELALDERRQQRRQHELGDRPPTARPTARAAGTRAPRPTPDNPGSAVGTTSTARHSSGIGWRASSGAGRSTPRPHRRPRPPGRPARTSTCPPPSARRAPPPGRAPARRRRAPPARRAPGRRQAPAWCRIRVRRAAGSPRPRADARRP